MTPLKIAAATSLVVPCAELPEPLRPRVRDVLPEPPRRINRLTELALLGAHRCVGKARPEPRCPLYLALSHGTVADNVALVGGVSQRNAPPNPIGFINLSSNMAGFHVAATLGVHGSNQAIAASEFSFEAALELASLGHEHRAQALIGAVEECAWPLAAQRERLGLPADAPLAESSHWLFADARCAKPLATVQWVRRYASADEARAALGREPVPAQAWGHGAAQRICRFIEGGNGAELLHVSATPRGCYAVFVTR